MKKEIMKILAMKREDLHGKKRYLYYILYFSVIIVQVLVLLYLGERLSFGMFLLVSAVYISLLLVLALETRKIRSRMELSE